MPRNSNYKQVKPQDPGVCAKKLSKPLQAFRPEQIENKEREKKSQTEPNRHAKTNKAVSFPAKTGKDPPRTPQN